MKGAVGFWNRKGGVGKTTLSLHLAGMLSKYMTVLLIDQDTQESTISLVEKGNFTFSVTNTFKGVKNTKEDFVIFDLPAGQSVIPKPKTVFVPFLPSVIDYEPTKGTKAFLMRQGKTVVEICNRVRGNQAIDREVVEKLSKKQKDRIISDRTIYQYSLNSGFTIFDDEIYNVYKNKKKIIDNVRVEFENVFMPFFKNII
ncbi:MAG: AAA family ATPase [bacterium]